MPISLFATVELLVLVSAAGALDASILLAECTLINRSISPENVNVALESPADHCKLGSNGKTGR